MASVVWVFIVPKNSSSSSYSSSSSSLEKIAGDSITQITVDVSGAVKNPGVYKLPAGSRFGDALVAAGNPTPTADAEYLAKQINLASELRDGQKIYLPFQGETVPNLSNKSNLTNSTNLISVNSASSSELDTLPEIGPERAAKIIAGRPYGSIEELVTKKAVSQSVYEKIKSQISL